MDSIVSAAIEEVCLREKDGIPVAEIWPSLRKSLSAAGLPPCEAVNKAIWARLLAHPGIQFKANGSPLGSQDPSILSLEEAERTGVKIVAEDHLRDSFLGIDDLKASSFSISAIQRAVLEHLAAARTNGVTQSELAKIFRIEGNKLFYILRQLESQQLIVRQSTILRAKEFGTHGDNVPKNTSVVSTNLLHSYRYAKHLNLNSQQRFEIIREDILEGTGHTDGSPSNGDEASSDFAKDNVSVKDYIPAMKAICDKLEEASGKVLVVSDIKLSLGYRMTSGHRAWRNILQRLKDAHLVEEFQAKVNKKVISCLRLLKKFDSRDFQPKKSMCRHDSFENENLTKIGKRGHITDQFVELPLEHRIYDMIDAEGQKGLTISEVCSRLGFTTKKLYKQISAMRERFKMPWEAELHERTPVYRIWTFTNYPRHSSDTLCIEHDALRDKNGLLYQPKKLASPVHQSTNSCSTSGLLPLEKTNCGSVGLMPCSSSPGWDQDAQEIKRRVDQQNNTNELPSMEITQEPNAQQLEESHFASSVSPEVKVVQRNRLFSTSNTTTREERIVKKLKKEKFILTVELYRWLEELEKGKHTKMCRRTLTHTLNKLQKEGLCKCIQVSIPVVTNFNRHRISQVILHPSVDNLSPELLEEIYRKQRNFDIRIRVQSSARSRNDQPVQKLTNLKMTSKHMYDKPVCLEAMRANGFVLASMVRAKLLHKFLWSYVSNSPNWHDAVNSNNCGSPHSMCQLFALDKAVKVMPLELFLQVVGSPQEIENIVERCRLGFRLLDMPLSEYKSLLDTGATCRLSRIINILVRLKLIQLVKEGLAEENSGLPHAVLTYAMELKPHIEEPMTRTLTPPHVKVDLRPRIRHDFVLLKPEDVDVYWETLEYCYAAADRVAASHAFPGSSVHEVFYVRSWTSVRVMTTEQRMELQKCVNSVGPKKKISFQDCRRIARELNLTVDQVLRVSYDRRQCRLHRYSSSSKSREQENNIDGENCESFDRKRKKSFKDGSRAFEQNEALGPSEKIFTAVVANEGHNNVKHGVDSEMHVEDGRNRALISRAFPRKRPMRAKRFSWTDKLDRQLVMQYARHRAILGARFYRVDWTSLSDLPALPSTCSRRMAVLNGNINVRRSIMRLCNLLGEQYAKYLEKTHMTKDKGSLTQNLSLTRESISESNFQQYYWDNSEDPDLKIAVDEVLRYKRLAKFQYAKRLGARYAKEWPDIPPSNGTNSDVEESPALKEQDIISECGVNGSQKHNVRCKKVNVISTSPGRSSSHHSHRSLMKILNGRYAMMEKKVCESLAVANAVELLKLVFLSTSVAPEVQSSLVATLQLYLERDIFAAVNYLKEKNFMVVGHGSRPFVLSKKFWHHASSSPFPIDTGKRAVDFSSWLSKQEKNLMKNGVSLTRDLQCGELCQLFALVSSGELSISPCLPREGIGEVDEPVEHDKVDDSNNLKRKSGDVELRNLKKVKKPRFEMIIDSDYCSRREKGFPGIRVVLNREIISQADTFWNLTQQENLNCSFSFDKNNERLSCEAIGSASLRNFMSQNCGSSAVVLNELPWDAMISYAECLSTEHHDNNKTTKFSPELFKSVHSAVCQAGEQGLDMKEISVAMGMQGGKLAEVIMDTLEVFQLVIKVHSFDGIRILDSSYKSKYFISMPRVQHPDHKMPSYMKSRVTSYGTSRQNFEKKPDITCDFPGMKLYDGHKVTILDLPSQSVELNVEGQDIQSGATLPEESMKVADSDHGKEVEDGNCTTVSETHLSCPILPWINGDGSINTIVYKGLTRRLLGTVMQNPSILEEDIIRRMDVLNPQSCRRLLELMVLENHLTVRMLYQTPSSAPVMLQKLFGSSSSTAEPVFRKHFFTNPLRTTLL